jgi:6-phosphogluconolactonase (cycloisomerase 2 family)
VASSARTWWSAASARPQRAGPTSAAPGNPVRARPAGAATIPAISSAPPDGRHVYFANRSLDTISTFEVSGATPVLVSELDSQAQWPQHLLATESHVLVAGWDSSTVKALPLANGVPTGVTQLFDCPGAGWLLLWN